MWRTEQRQTSQRGGAVESRGNKYTFKTNQTLLALLVMLTHQDVYMRVLNVQCEVGRGAQLTALNDQQSVGQ